MKKELWIIFSIVFLGLLGFGIVIPTLPFIAEDYGASPTQIGLILASYSLFQFIASPILGRLSDRYGRKPVLAVSLLGSALGFFIIAYAKSLLWILTSRIIDGITGGNISVAQAYIADITEGKERTKAMGLIGAAFGLGFVFGPIAGGLLSVYGAGIPYLVAGILALADSILIMLILPESEKKAIREKVSRGFFNKETLQKIFVPKSILYLTSAFFMVTFTFSLMQGMFALYSQELFGWTQRENGYFFSVIGVVMIITQGVVIRQLVKSYSDKKLIKFSLPFLAMTFMIFGILRSQPLYYLTAIFLALFFGIFNTTIQAEISNESDPEEQGIVLGTVQGINALARAIGPVVGGFLFSNVSINSPFIVSSGFLFLMTGVIYSRRFLPRR